MSRFLQLSVVLAVALSISAAVQLESVRPAYGVVGGGTETILTGSGFDYTTTVTIGGAAAIVNYAFPGRISVTTPPHADGIADVAVAGSDGSSAILPGGFLYESSPRHEPFVVADINQNIVNSASGPARQLAANGAIYFFRTLPDVGLQLWKTDGTPAGTMMVKTITQAGVASVYFRFAHGPFFYFTIFNDYTSETLWRTDGTAAGTFPLMSTDGRPTTNGPGIVPMAGLGDLYFFQAFRQSTGTELWRTDGTTAGTQLVKDIYPGSTPSLPASPFVFNNELYFAAASDGTGQDLWKTDGTGAGTVRALDVLPGSLCWDMTLLRDYNGALYFLASSTHAGDQTLYRWDGVSTTAEPLHGFLRPPSSPTTFWGESVLFNNDLYFSAGTAEGGSELWRTDGTPGGTVQVSDINSGSASSGPSRLAAVGNHLIFFADDGVHGRELWATDGTTTSLIKEIIQGAAGTSVFEIVSLNGTVYFVALDSGIDHGSLWKSDGTADGTTLLADGGGVHVIDYELSIFAGEVVFATTADIWKTDGTTGGTLPVTSLSYDDYGTASSNPKELTRLGNRLYFTASPNAVDGLYWTDIESLQTVLVSNAMANLQSFVTFKGTLYFTAYDTEHGQELWKSDGTPGGTMLVNDLTPGPNSTFFLSSDHLIPSSDFLYFIAQNNLYRTDGTADGSSLVARAVSSAVNLNGQIYYVTSSGLYRFDGTQSTLISSNAVTSITSLGGRIYFSAESQLWSVDDAGVVTKIADVSSNSTSAIVGDYVYLAGAHLIKTDGTPAGTTVVCDLSQPANLIAAGGKLFFTNSDALHGVELWVTDGSPAGTHLVRDIYPGMTSAFGDTAGVQWADVNRNLFFVANDGVHGTDLWKTDGTDAGTYLYYDFEPSHVSEPLQAGSRLFLVGDGREGVELRAIDVDPPVALSAIAPKSGPSSGGTTLTLTGANLLTGTDASLAGVPMQNVTYTSTTQISGTTPALLPGRLYDVNVSNGESATLPNAFFSDFLDVPQAHPFHRFVESIVRAGVTSGCTPGSYCVDDPTTRAQMAVFLLRAFHGRSYVPPSATGTMFGDVAANSFAAAWIEEFAREGITAGCGGGNYCPNSPVTRAQMAVFLLRTSHGITFAPPPATGVFTDVPVGSFAASWIEELYHEGITGGCSASPLNYCPDSSVTRGQMAVFVTVAASLP